jgi:hypothetical protein
MNGNSSSSQYYNLPGSTWTPDHNNAYPWDGLVGIEELIQQQLSEGFSEGCYPSSLEERKTQSHRNCSFEGNVLFSISFNQTHRLN